MANQINIDAWTFCYNIAVAVQEHEVPEVYFKQARHIALLLEAEFGCSVTSNLQSAEDWNIVRSDA